MRCKVCNGQGKFPSQGILPHCQSLQEIVANTFKCDVCDGRGIPFVPILMLGPFISFINTHICVVKKDLWK